MNKKVEKLRIPETRTTPLGKNPFHVSFFVAQPQLEKMPWFHWAFSLIAETSFGKN